MLDTPRLTQQDLYPVFLGTKLLTITAIGEKMPWNESLFSEQKFKITQFKSFVHIKNTHKKNTPSPRENPLNQHNKKKTKPTQSKITDDPHFKTGCVDLVWVGILNCIAQDKEPSSFPGKKITNHPSNCQWLGICRQVRLAARPHSRVLKTRLSQLKVN